LQMLKEHFKERTVILSTQKLSLLDAVDRVIVMHHGEVYLDGPKKEVLARLRGDRDVKTQR